MITARLGLITVVVLPILEGGGWYILMITKSYLMITKTNTVIDLIIIATISFP